MVDAEPDIDRNAAAPLVLTLAVEPAAQAEFQAQRDLYYPASLNCV